MYCRHCGSQISDQARFCPNCGTETSIQKQPASPVYNHGYNGSESQNGDRIQSESSNAGSSGGHDDTNNGYGNNGSQNAYGNQSYGNNGSQNTYGNQSYESSGYGNNGSRNAYSNQSYESNGSYSSNGYQNGSYTNNGYSNQGYGNSYGNNGYYGREGSDPYYRSNYSNGLRLQTDRSLVLYILLTIVTCGIYGFYFIYKMAADVNTACEGDGEETAGLVAFIILSMVTCGIYSWIWYYKLGNRLADNAPRYGMTFREDGTTVIVWCLVGILVCGIGPYVAMYILIKNTNAICMAYNRAHNLA